MKPPESESAPLDTRSERLNLQLWRSEVREFCEDALRQLQQLTDALISNTDAMNLLPDITEQPSGRPDSGPFAESVPLAERTIPSASEIDDLQDLDEEANSPLGMDSSRSRLENLKRQLSEKLEQSESDAWNEPPPRSDNR